MRFTLDTNYYLQSCNISDLNSYISKLHNIMLTLKDIHITCAHDWFNFLDVLPYCIHDSFISLLKAIYKSGDEILAQTE